MPRLTLQQYFTDSYSPIGNILSSPQGTYLYEGSQGVSYANPHAATSIGTITMTYDNNGNLLDRFDGVSPVSHFWDYQNRLLKVGRFLSKDPSFLLVGDQNFEKKYRRSLESFLSDPQELNSYSYVKNNPLRFTDPSGEELFFSGIYITTRENILWLQRR